jgi:hypothetical protein
LGFTLVGGRLDGSDDVIAAIDALTAAGVGDMLRANQHRAAMEVMRRAASACDVTVVTRGRLDRWERWGVCQHH